MLSHEYEDKFFLLTKQSRTARHCEKAVSSPHVIARKAGLSYKYEDKFFLLTKQSPDIGQQTIREIAATRHCEESSVVI